MNFFWQAVQKAGETVDQFATRLRKLGAHCEFPNLERELKSAIIQNCHSKCLWRFALWEQALMLDRLLTKARALEASETQGSGIKKSLLPENVTSFIKIKDDPLPNRSLVQKPTKCHNCGSAWPHKNGLCPAKGWTCRKCGRPNHFAKSVLLPRTSDKTLEGLSSWATSNCQMIGSWWWILVQTRSRLNNKVENTTGECQSKRCSHWLYRYSLDITPPSIISPLTICIEQKNSATQTNERKVKLTVPPYIESSYLLANDTPTKWLATQRQACS